jgi:hypothetical protein
MIGDDVREHWDRFLETLWALFLDILTGLFFQLLIRAAQEATPYIWMGTAEPIVAGHDLHTIWAYAKVIAFLGWITISTLNFFRLLWRLK